MLDKGCSHFIGMTGELSTNLLGPFSLGGGGGGGEATFASIVEKNCLVAISNGASLTALSASGGPPFGTPSSSDAQGSLRVSWVAPSKASRASVARSGESTVITTELF